jgi:hypothetical protein
MPASTNSLYRYSLKYVTRGVSRESRARGSIIAVNVG